MGGAFANSEDVHVNGAALGPILTLQVNAKDDCCHTSTHDSINSTKRACKVEKKCLVALHDVSGHSRKIHSL